MNRKHFFIVVVATLLMQFGWMAQAEETPEHKEKVKVHWDRMVKLQDAELGTITFVGRVIDQNGDPVAAAKVDIEVSGNYLASGDAGSGAVHTDSNGYFEVNNLRGVSMGIYDVVKSGYETHTKTTQGNLKGAEDLPMYPRFHAFKAHSNALLWLDYTREHPYIIKAYKVGKYAQVKSDDAGSLGFVPDGSMYTVDFSGNDKVKFEGIREGDIRVSFTRNEKDWKVKIDAVDGGVARNQ